MNKEALAYAQKTTFKSTFFYNFLALLGAFELVFFVMPRTEPGSYNWLMYVFYFAPIMIGNVMIFRINYRFFLQNVLDKNDEPIVKTGSFPETDEERLNRYLLDSRIFMNKALLLHYSVDSRFVEMNDNSKHIVGNIIHDMLYHRIVDICMSKEEPYTLAARWGLSLEEIETIRAKGIPE